ncbi:serine/threonine-protein kinase 24-like isoform X1 [Artemia franciscana]|uniref:serine/threonine-protein kinase 24-like isoform X1 n=1 Tax=Artemia franciscana TaxID=6661 RepID=UPI0032DA3B84
MVHDYGYRQNNCLILATTKRFGSAEHLNRWSEIKTQIEETDGYIMKTEELKYGGTVAWRNAPRCPGRIQWNKVQAACEAFHIKLPTKAVVTIGTESVQEPVQSNMKLVSADASEGPHFTEYSFAVMRKYIWKFHQKCCGLLIRMILLATVISLVSTKQIAREKADPLTIYHNFVPLGRGGFGAVFKAQDKFTNETVAIKIVDVEQPHRSSEKIYREVEAFAKLQSPYFPKFYGSYRRDQKLWIIMEFINGSSAMDLMMRGPVDEFYIRIILREVLKGINYFHSNNLIHRDIKAANILIGGNGEVKIGDLGGIIEATDSQWISGQDTMYGTRLWLSPEQLFNSRYNKKVFIDSLE